MISKFNKYKLITEDPDKIDVDDEGYNGIGATNDDAVTFGYTEDGTFKIAPWSTHYNLGIERRNPGSGRLWKDKKIVSFWTNPEDIEDFSKLLKDIYTASKIKVDKSWVFDDWQDYMIAPMDVFVKDYYGERDFTLEELEEREKKRVSILSISHTDSPEEKERKRKQQQIIDKEKGIEREISKTGSNKIPNDFGNNKSMAEYRAKKYQENVISFEEYTKKGDS